jgi:N-acetylmuramic acid 6-phosphate etherase
MAGDVVIRPPLARGGNSLTRLVPQHRRAQHDPTLAMVQMNKVYENLMVDLRATNTKLWDRAARIISTLTNLPREQAMELLKQSDGHVKVAIVMHKRGLSADDARALLSKHDGNLREAIDD